MTQKQKIGLIAPMCTLIVCILAGGLLLFNGVLTLNRPSKQNYPVRGADVSSYQGDIDWNILKEQDISFAFIKATEGSSHVDKYFIQNLNGAKEAGIYTGAYHFFSYDSDGFSQAENFISTVPKTIGMLPPVVDIEFYGDKEKNLPDRESTRENLTRMLHRLEEYYGVKPMIYATQKSYRLYIADAFPEHPIWIRNVFLPPHLPDRKAPLFWQYTDRAHLKGYTGQEKFIDLNVFCGTQEEFLQFVN